MYFNSKATLTSNTNYWLYKSCRTCVTNHMGGAHMHTDFLDKAVSRNHIVSNNWEWIMLMFLQLWWIVGSLETVHVACQVVMWLLCIVLVTSPTHFLLQSIIRHWAQEVGQQPPTIPAISSDMFLLQQIYWHQTRYGNVLWVSVFWFIHLERGGTIGRHFGGERGQAPTGTKVSYTCTYSSELF